MFDSKERMSEEYRLRNLKDPLEGYLKEIISDIRLISQTFLDDGVQYRSGERECTSMKLL